ncbi:MAG TPA: 2-dehydropantoate 2-reductase [Anaerolineales bacterium]|nr:2-dehydropantoate 2-reductase [Anaerolineales bacterium]HRQ92475.1 2-dehydropantoate 2-reductase [Anaerolineales bacterium]
MSTLIVGSGALACLFAARLAAIGEAVSMLATWPEGLRALQETGATLEYDDTRTTFPVRASNNPQDFAGAARALVLVKSWQTTRVAEQLQACLAPEGVALTLQNGLGNQETLVSALDAARVAVGVITTGATLLGPGIVRWGGDGIITLGAHAQQASFAALFEQAGFQVHLAESVASVQWSKLVINAAINPLTALLNIPNGELLTRPAAAALSAQLAQEAAATAAALDIPLTFADPVAAAQDVARRTAANHSSMLQDVLRGAPTEINAICGAIVRAGQSAGVPTPANDMLWKLVEALTPA